jgi:DHHW protein
MNKRIVAYINLITFTTILLVGGIWFFLQKPLAISEVEKRKLTDFPAFNSDSLFAGAYTKSIDLYVADHFPLREHFVSFSFYLADHRGIRDEEIKLYDAGSLKKDMNTELVQGNTDSATDSTNTVSETVADSSGATGDGGDIVSNMLIYNGMAIQFFGGNDNMGKTYATAINKFRAAWGSEVTIYDIVVPSTADLYMPEQFKKRSSSEKRNIDVIYANLTPTIRKPDAYSLMMEHKDEYLFFNTDHHWTGTGAYYAYSAFCTTAGVGPVQFSQCERKVRKNFLGSLYQLCRDQRLRSNPDSAVYYKVPGPYKCWRYTDNNIEKGISIPLYAESGYGYGVYLGGDYPLMKIETEKKTGRSAVLIKNSFGNGFAPYLVYNFDKVYVIDYRYFNHSLIDFVNNNGITDVIFLNNSFSANTSWHIRQIEKLLKGVNKTKVKPTDSIPADPADTNRKKKTIPDSIKH